MQYLCFSFFFIFKFYLFYYKFIYFNWRLITLPYCIGIAIHQHESVTGIHVSPHAELPIHFPAHPISPGCPSALALGALLHSSNLHCSYVLQMVIYMFQCYSLKSSHPRLLPQSPKVTSVSLLLSHI